jgi:hypothetical protein
MNLFTTTKMKINDMNIYAHPVNETAVEIRYEDGIALRDDEWTYPRINGNRVYLNDEAEETVIIERDEAIALGIEIDEVLIHGTTFDETCQIMNWID